MRAGVCRRYRDFQHCRRVPHPPVCAWRRFAGIVSQLRDNLKADIEIHIVQALPNGRHADFLPFSIWTGVLPAAGQPLTLSAKSGCSEISQHDFVKPNPEVADLSRMNGKMGRLRVRMRR